MAESRSWTTLFLTLLVAAGVAGVASAPDEKPKEKESDVAKTETPAGDASLQPSLEIAEPGTLDLRLDPSGKGSVSLVLKNGAGKRTVTLDLLLSNGSASLKAQTVELTPASAALVKVEIEGATQCPCRGVLVIVSKSPPALPEHAAITLTPSPAATGAAAQTVWFGFAFALLAVAIGFFFLYGGLNSPLDSPSWEPGKSWLTNLAVVGAVFNAIFSVTALTEKLRSMTASELLMTTTLFAALAALAPAIFDLLAAPSPLGGTKGNAGWFLAAVFFTLWAASGQLALTFVLTGDADQAALLRSDVCVLVRFLLGALLLAVFVYALRSIWSVRAKEGAPEAARLEAVAHPASWRLL
jgi:hypothetical protein